jgi:hypothetical protein
MFGPASGLIGISVGNPHNRRLCHTIAKGLFLRFLSFFQCVILIMKVSCRRWIYFNGQALDELPGNVAHARLTKFSCLLVKQYAAWARLPYLVFPTVAINKLGTGRNYSRIRG